MAALVPRDIEGFARGEKGLFFVAGPCVVESKDLCLRVAESLARAAGQYECPIVFKASYDKANRTSQRSFRGPGKEEGLRILENVREQSGLPVLTDIHDPADAEPTAQVADIIQIPAFLCRQTDLLAAAGATGKRVNIKKGQFMAPEDMKYAVEKAGNKCWLTERGTFFGYNRLVVDFTGIATMKSLGVPVVFDATHSVQTPGGSGGKSGGNRALAVPLARAAVSCGADGLFFEVHPEPENALCDGPNSMYLAEFVDAIPRFMDLYSAIGG
ncbi:MAG: 3-deoxy-8-phosphooctulonate synthase, partial [Chitinivibrionales bacterium]|nr:3-deoxy-8-phosphooctulonate synthase [Chitinivibrionales bacterium]MBD3396906.1 3-deoxy-8-phosphooctulonate synthase [Chitinivibrionales bacterium]